MMERMDTQTTSTEEALRTLLERTAVLQERCAAQQASLDALAASVAEVRDGQVVMQAAVTSLQVDTANIKGTMAHHATQAEVISVRSELYKALQEQTMRLFFWLTAVGSGLTAAVYYIARNVH
jgi:uncharacterized protein YoxC